MKVSLSCSLGCLAILASSACLASAGCREVIVSNEGSGDIAIVDPRTLKVTATIPVGAHPRGIALSPDRERLYVALRSSTAVPPGTEQPAGPSTNRHADGIGVIDLATARFGRLIEGISEPADIAVSSDGSRLFVSSQDEGLVMMFDAESGDRLASTPVGAAAKSVDLGRGGVRLYATSAREDRVSVLDAVSLTMRSRIRVGSRPRSTAFSPDGLHAYVANEAARSVSVVDTATLRVVKTIRFPAGKPPMRIIVPPAGSPLYVSTGRGRVILTVDPHSGRIKARAPSGARPLEMAMNPDATELYVANGSSNDISVFALPRLELRARVRTGEKPWGIVCRDDWWAREGLGAPGSLIP